MGSIRTLLAIAVVFTHMPWHNSYVLVGGQNAVRLFYIISGFLISYVLENNPTYRNPIKFYANRALKIYPIYYFVLALTAIATLTFGTSAFEIYKSIPASANALLATSTLLIFGQDLVMFTGVKDGALVFMENFRQSDVQLWKGLLLPQAWTLGLELTFYVLAPFIVRSKLLLGGLLAMSVSVRLWLTYLGLIDTDPWSYRFFPAELCLFMAGMLANRFLLPVWLRVVQLKWGAHFPAAATLSLLILCSLYFEIEAPENVKVSSLLCIFILLLPLTFLFQNSSRFDKAVGELSYPIYIGHLLVIAFTTKLLARVGLDLQPFAVALINLVLVCAFGFVLNATVAARVERWRARIRRSGMGG